MCVFISVFVRELESINYKSQTHKHTLNDAHTRTYGERKRERKRERERERERDKTPKTTRVSQNVRTWPIIFGIDLPATKSSLFLFIL